MDNPEQSQAPVFTPPATPEPAPVFSAVQPPAPPQNSDTQVHMTSLLSALASQRNDPESQSKTMLDLVTDAKQRIQAGGEGQLRADASNDKLQADTAALHEEQRNLIASQNEYGIPKDEIKASMDQEAELAAQPVDPHAIEKEGVAALHEQASQDPQQALVQHDLVKQDPVVVLNTQDNLVFMTAWNKAVDGLRQEVQHEGWLHRAVDMLAVLPFQQAYATAHAVPGAQDALIPGSILEAQVHRLQEMDLQHRLAAIPDVIEGIRKNSGVFTENLDLTLSVLQGVLGTSAVDKMGMNLWAASDAVNTVGLAKFVTTPFKLAMAVGNRTAAVNSVAADALRDIHGLPEQVGGTGTLNGTSWVEGLVPSKWKTGGMLGPGPGVSGSVVKRLKQSQDAIQSFLSTVSRNDRVNAAQVQQLIEEQKQRFAKELDGQNILDITNSGTMYGGYGEDLIKTANYKEMISAPEKTVRLYRGEIVGGQAAIPGSPSTGGWFTSNFSKASKFGKLYHIDVTEEEAKEFMQGHGGPDEFLTTNPKFRARMEPSNATTDRVHNTFTRQTLGPSDFQPRFNPTEAAAVVQSARADVEKTSEYLAKRQAKITFQQTQDEQTGLYQLSAYVGDHQGIGGYRNIEQAKQGILDRGWDPKDVQLVQMPDTSIALKVTQTVREDMPFTPNMTTTQRAWGRFALFLKDANDMRAIAHQGPALRALGIEAGIKDQAILPLVKRIQAVGPKNREFLQKVVDLGNQEVVEGQSQPGRWYNLTEFNTHFERVSGKPPTNKEVLAYYSFKQMRDLDYYVRNRELHISLARRGVQTVSVQNEAVHGVNIPRQNGRVLEGYDLNSDRFMDADTGKVYPAGKAPQEIVNYKLQSGQYRIIELQDPYGPKNNPVKHILAHKDNSTVGPLARHQLDYTGGSPVDYTGHYFTKQANSVRVDGEDRWLSPLTHANHQTQPEAAEYAARHNAAQAAYKEIKAAQDEAGQFSNLRAKAGRAAKQKVADLMAQHDAVFKRSEANSFEKWDELANNGRISQHPFEAVYDNGLPTAMNAGNARRWFDTEENSIESLHKTKGRLYYSERGERLNDGGGKLAPVVDSWKASLDAMSQAIKTFAFGDYHTMVTENWVRLARQSGLLREEDLKNHSTANVFLHARFDEGLARATEQTQQIAARLENDRQLHMRLLGMRTEQQMMDNMNARRLAASIAGHGKLSDWAASEILDLKSKNPMQAIRSGVYDIGIAMWNVARFVIHGFTSVVAMTIHPVYGGRAATMYPLMRLMQINRGDELLDHVAENYGLIHGFSPDSFKQMVQGFRNTQRFYMGDAMEVAESMAGRLGSTTVGQGFASVRRGGRIFFNEAERMNQIIGWQIAWHDALDQPGLKEGTKEFEDYVLRKSSVLTNSMSRASSAMWQKGVFGMPGQFHTLQARLLEKMLPKQFGGNQLLTGAQRARFVVGGLLLLGAKSVPGLPELSQWGAEQYEKATGQPISDSTWKEISNGLIDSTLFGITDGKLDTDWAGRVGLGATLDDLARGINTSLLQGIGGATEQYVGKMGGNIIQIAKIFAAAQVDGEFTSEDFELVAEDLAKILPAFNNADRAYYIFRYGMVKDPRTGQTIAKVDRLNALAAELGVPISSEVDYWNEGRTQENREQYIQKQAQMVLQLQNNAFDAMLKGDDKGALHYKRLISGMMTAYQGDPIMRREITDAMYKLDKKGPDEFEDLLRRMYLRDGNYPLGHREKR